MAKLFANKFDLDRLPEPKKPSGDINQGSVVINRTTSENKITDPNIQTQLVDQGSKITDPKLDIKPIDQGSKITNPETKVDLVDQGDKITNPNIEVQKVISGELITNPNIRIEPVEPTQLETQALNSRLREVDNEKQGILTSDQILERQGVRKSSAGEYVSSVKVEPFGTNPVNQGGISVVRATEPQDKISNVEVSKVDQGSKIVDPKIETKLVDQGEQIVNPNTQVQKVIANELITNPNLEIKPIEQGDRTVNPNTTVQKIQPGDRIVNPNIEVSPVNANELIINPNTIIQRVVADELITNPNIQPILTKPVDPNVQVPNNVVGVGTTILFPRSISLKNRLEQSDLGTTRHLPEYLLSDLNTGIIDITSQNLIPKTSQVDVQKISYQDTVLKQGGIETILNDVVSIVNPFKFGQTEVEQGSVTIKNLQTVIKKTSPVEIKKVAVGERTIDPKTEIVKVKSGERTVDPKTKIKPIVAGERTTDPNTKVVAIKPGERTIDPKTKINPIIPGERTTDPDIKIPLVQPGERTIDPKIEIKPIAVGERTIDPKIVIQPITPGERTTDPQLEIKPIVAGERTFDPMLEIPLIEPGDRTIDPKTVVRPVEPGERTTIVENRLYLFPQSDDKIFYTQEPEVFVNTYDIFPSDGYIPLTSDGRFNEYSTDLAYVSALNSLQLTENGQTKLKSAIQPNDLPGQGTYQEVVLGGAADSSGVIFWSHNTDPIKILKPNGGASRYNQVDAYVQRGTGVLSNESKLKTAGSEDAPAYVEEIAIEGGFTDLVKPLNFPPAQHGDPTLPGGYRLLNYGEIQRRRESGEGRNLDFTYNLGDIKLDPYPQRIGMPDRGADTLNTAYNKTGNDFVAMKFESVRDSVTIQFRSFLKGFTDNYTANYTDVNYVGRPDTLKVFKGTTRQLSISFTVPVFSEDEIKVVYEKLEELIKISSIGKRDGIYMQGPFLRMTVGGWCKRTPIIVSSLKFETNPTEYTWDIEREIPQIVEVSMDCTALSDNTGKGFLQEGTFIQYGNR